MKSASEVITNTYRDSVSLMQLSSKLSGLPGIEQASIIMATENNLDLLVEAGLLEERGEPSPADMLIVVQGANQKAVEQALSEAKRLLEQVEQTPSIGQKSDQPAVSSLVMALGRMPEANLALVSTPGEYAAAEALKALRSGLNVMIFSDNVGLEDEILLKRYARDRDLLVMGPDCGSAIINGVPLGFANVVRAGDIGIVAASGTGLQEVTSLIDRHGGGVTQAFGTGGRDLHGEVGGISMIQGIRQLGSDKDTRVLLLVSKPPSPDVMKSVLREASGTDKPVVVAFIGADTGSIAGKNLHAVETLEAAALTAVSLSKGEQAESADTEYVISGDVISEAASKLGSRQRYIRGLFSGGTFCYEAINILSSEFDAIYSNITKDPKFKLKDVWQSKGHTAIDLGEDAFTRGRPHPMIDHRLRNDRILQEAADPEVGVIVLDVVLGYGAHEDPASVMAPVIRQAAESAKDRAIVFVGYVCGTRGDPQNLEFQERVLREAGVLLARSNAHAARLASAIARRVGKH